MESNARSGQRRNDVLSQSYIQGVERVARRSKDDAGFNFDLPREVLEEREKAWGSFFEKYAEEMSDEIELNIDTMEPVGKEEDDEDEPKEYYSKCRAPMRKLPALIQYWIDTGNPPYQLIGEEDHSETGSSLSEGEHSRSGQSAVLRESIENKKFNENSPYSSVDTAAYILSNVNVTKKAETQAIVEGAKGPDEALAIEPTERVKNVSLLSIERARRSVTARNAVESVVSPTAMPLPSDWRFNEPPVRSPIKVPLTNSPASQRSSVTLSDVLPALQQFDELLEKSRDSRTPVTRSALSKVRRKRKPPVGVVGDPNDGKALESSRGIFVEPSRILLAEPSRNSEESSRNGLGKTLNRRKLYTGRNSPVDLIVARTSTDSAGTTTATTTTTTTTRTTGATGQSSHPALDPVDNEQRRVVSLGSRARARRKRKRASQRQLDSKMPESQDGNTWRGSNEPINGDGNNNNNKNKKTENKEQAINKGQMRYADFFESLGLTPSKTIIGGVPEDETAAKWAKRKRSGNGVKSKGNKRSSKARGSREISMRETSAKIIAECANNGTNGLVDKIARVRIVRLSEKSLARYDKRKIGNHKATSSSRTLSNNKAASIELLTTMTHDSDSSTILICSCNNPNNGRYSDSESSLYGKDTVPNESSLVKRNKAKSGGSSSLESSKSLRKNDERTTRTVVKLTAASRNPVVKLEKLSQKDLPKLIKTTDGLRIISPKIKQPRRDSSGKFAKISSPPKIPIDLFDFSKGTEDTGCVTIGSRFFGESSRIETTQNETPPNREESLNRTLGICLDDDDEDENSFARLLRKVESAGSGNKDGRKKLPNGTSHIDEEIEEDDGKKIQRPVTRSRGVLGIAASSDEETDDPVMTARQARSTRRRRRVDTRDRGTIVEELVRDLTKDDEDESTGVENRLRLGESPCGVESELVARETDEIDNTGSSTRKEPVARNERESNDGNAIFRKSRETSLGEKLESRDKDSRPRKKRRVFDRTSDEKRSIGSARFQTRMDSDSDPNFDKLGLEGTSETSDKEPIIALKKLLDVRNERGVIPRGKKSIEAGKSNGSPLSSSSVGETREKLQIYQFRDTKNGKSRTRPVARRKVRRTRILGTPIEYESDEGGGGGGSELPGRTIDSSETARRNEISSGKNFNRRDEKSANDGLPNKRQRDFPINLFPNMLEDTIEDVDLLFGANGNSRVTRSSKGLIENLNLKNLDESSSIRKSNFTNTRQSTITFRTKFNTDSDDDNVL